MNPGELLKKYGGNDEQRILLGHVCDLIGAAEKRWQPCFTAFLSPADQAYLARITELKRAAEITFYGGYSDAERRMLSLVPKGCDEDIHWPIAILALRYKGERLRHRDILGALMSLGIRRDRVGDIIDLADPQLIVCEEALADYILQHLTQIARAKTEVTRGEIADIPEKSGTEIKATVASLRLDSILAEGFGLSRAKAADHIKRGNASVNWIPAVSASAEVKAGDRITLSGFGKIELSEIGGLSRKGRIFVKILCF